jgi:hypothetical protein
LFGQPQNQIEAGVKEPPKQLILESYKKENKMPKQRQETLGSDHFKTTFNIHVNDFGFKNKGDDGRPFHDPVDADWYDTTVYNGLMERRDGEFKLMMTWVDLQNKGHKIVLPDRVVTAIVHAHNRIIKKSRSEGAKKAHETRVADGTVNPIFHTGKKRQPADA